MLPPPQATLLLVFVHGFKGHDHHTFLDFPTRVMTIFTNAKLNLDVESIVYPQYDTRGDFNAAVDTFVTWTQQQVKSRQEFNDRVFARKDGQQDDEKKDIIPPVYVCILGHSMGGLVAADAALRMQTLPQKSPVIGILAFDTPFFGLNHTIFTQAAYERVTGFAQKASGAYSLVSAYLPAAAAWGALSPSSPGQDSSAKSSDTKRDQASSTGGFSPSSLWSSSSTVAKVEKEKSVSSTAAPAKWGWGSIALGVGAVVAATGAAVVVNSRMTSSMEYITSHVQFVGILWNSAQLKQRVEDVLRLPIGFHCFYTQVQIPATSSNGFRSGSRTFAELTSIPSSARSYFSARNCSGQDEIEAHMEMFNPSKNFDYYPMGEETVKRVKIMVEEALKRE